MSMLRLLRGEPGLLREIFSYDDTYRIIMQEVVIVELWQHIWQRYYRAVKQQSPCLAAVVGHLLHHWGVYSDDPYLSDRYRDDFLPDNLHVACEVDADGVFGAQLAMEIDGYAMLVFDGFVVTPHQNQAYERAFCEWGPAHAEALDVFEDPETGLIVYVFFT